MLEHIKIKLLIYFKLNVIFNGCITQGSEMILNGVIDSTKLKKMMYKNFKVNATNNAIFLFFFVNEQMKPFFNNLRNYKT